MGLMFLVELDEEAAGKIQDEEHGDECAAGALLLAELLVGQIERQEHQDAERRFIQLARVAKGRIGLAIEARESNTPGLIRGTADDLGIEPVPDSDQRRAQRRGEGETVGAFDERYASTLGEEPHREDQPDHRAVTRQTALPDAEHPERILQRLVEIVKEHVAQTGAEQHAEHSVDNEVSGVLFIPSATLDLPFEQPIAAQEDHYEDEAVVTKRDGPESHQDRVHIPSECRHLTPRGKAVAF